MSSAEKLTRMFLAAPSPPMVVFLGNAPLACRSAGPNVGLCENCLYVLNHGREEMAVERPGEVAQCLNVSDSSVKNDFAGSSAWDGGLNRTISEYQRLAVHYGVAHVSMLSSLDRVFGDGGEAAKRLNVSAMQFLAKFFSRSTHAANDLGTYLLADMMVCVCTCAP